MGSYRGPFHHGAKYRLTPLVFEILAVMAAQLVWWAAVLYGNVAAFIALVVQLLLLMFAQRLRRTEIKAALAVAATGLLFDAGTVAVSSVSFRDATDVGVPIWLALLWFSFALALPGLRQWLGSRRRQILVLATAGPLAYIAGARLGALEIHQTLLYALLLIVGWLVLPWYWQRLQREHAHTNETRHATTSH